MTKVEWLTWDAGTRPLYLRRFGVFTVLYWVAYIGGLFFAACLGRSFSDDVLILGGSSFYVVCIAAIALLLRANSLWSFAIIAVLTSAAFRLFALLPYYSETTPSALMENTLMHGALALISAAIAFTGTSFLFREQG